MGFKNKTEKFSESNNTTSSCTWPDCPHAQNPCSEAYLWGFIGCLIIFLILFGIVILAGNQMKTYVVREHGGHARPAPGDSEIRTNPNYISVKKRVIMFCYST